MRALLVVIFNFKAYFHLIFPINCYYITISLKNKRNEREILKLWRIKAKLNIVAGARAPILALRPMVAHSAIFLCFIGICVCFFEQSVNPEDFLKESFSNESLVKAGIVTTVRQPGKEFDSWLCYHLGIGSLFYLILIFESN